MSASATQGGHKKERKKKLQCKIIMVCPIFHIYSDHKKSEEHRQPIPEPPYSAGAHPSRILLPLKPNSITLAGSKLVADRLEAGRRPASNQLV